MTSSFSKLHSKISVPAVVYPKDYAGSFQVKIVAHGRNISGKDYDACSVVLGEMSWFERYFLRYIYDSDIVQEVLSAFLLAVAQEVSRRIGPKRAIKLLSESNPRYSLDTLFGDVFRLLYNPEYRIRPDRSFAVMGIIGLLTDDIIFTLLRETCVGDAPKSAVAAITILQTMKDRGDTGDVVESVAEFISGDSSSPIPTGPSLIQAWIDAAKDVVRGVGEHSDELEQMAQQMAGRDQFVVNKTDVSMAKAAAKLACDLVSSGVQLDIVYDAFGRVEGYFADAITDEALFGDGEVVDLRLGGALSEVVASEHTMSVIPELSVLQDIRLAEGSLLCQQRRGIDSVGGGPVIVLLDVSISMADSVRLGDEHYQKISVASAFAFALAKRALAWNRTVAIVPFNHEPIESLSVIQRPDEFLSADEYMSKLVRAVGCHPQGSTSFVRAVKFAGELIRESPRYEQADIVFFSDGEGDAPHGDKAAALRRKFVPANTRIYGLFIAGSKSSADNLEKSNNDLFDVCVGATGDNVGDAIKRLYAAMLEHTFLHVDEMEDST